MKNKTFKYDIILLVVIILFTFCTFLFNKGKTGTYVKITSHQKEYGIYDISINKTINIDNENIIQIRNGEVYMKSATCPDQICIKQGHISQSGASIICLPHELIVEITGEEGDLDDKAY